MAMTYQNFASLGVNLNRQKYGPLDISNVFTSAADLKYYLSKGTFTTGVSEYWYKNANEKIVPYPYEGQVLATVIDGIVEVFVLALDAEGNFETREIAGKIDVDGTTIVKDADGKLSIVAPVNPDDKKTYNFAYANGVYSWVEVDTATAAGQAQAIQSLTDRTVALEEAVNGKGEGEEHVVGLVEKVAANAQAIADEISAREAAIGKAAEGDAAATGVYAAIAEALHDAKAYADAQDADTVYDDTALAARVKAIEDDYLKEADKYDDSEVRELISDVDDVIGDSEGGLVKDIADNKKAIEDEMSRAAEAERLLGERIDAIDFVNEDELATAIDEATDPISSDLADLKARVEAFLDNTGAATEAIDTLQELITYINEHDDVEITNILADIKAIQDKLAGIDSTVAAHVAAAIEALNIGDYAKASDLVDLAARVSAIEENGATKAEVQDVDAKFAQYTTTDGLNTALASKVDNDAFDTFKSENTAAIITAQEAAVVAAKSETEAQIEALESAVAETYATKAGLGEAISGVENDLLAYAKTADVEAELAKKIETGSIAHSTESAAEGVTVDGTKLNIVVDAYTKEETLAKIDEKITSFTGGESAADVKNALDSYKETNNARVGAIETKNNDQDVAIAAAQTQADKGVADAKKVSDDLAAANIVIGQNTNEINVVKGTITTVNETLSSKITSLENKDVELAGLVSGLDTAVKENAATIGDHTAAIAALQTKDSELVGQISGIDAKFGNYYDKDTVDSKVQAVADSVGAIDLSPYAKTEDVNSAVETINASIANKADAANVYTKDEADAEFMTQDEVDARINTLIAASDPDNDGNVITNIQKLVEYVENNADDITALITNVGNNATAIEKNVADISANTTAIDAINDAIAALIQPKASNEITVGADGTLCIGEVSTDKLVQGNDVLVLNGGNATNSVE